MKIRNIILIISKNLDFDYQIKLRMCHKFLYQNIRITSIPRMRIRLMTDEGIKNLDNLNSLDLKMNSNITDEGIKDLVNLTSLTLWGHCRITNRGIKNLFNLTYLCLAWNTNITDDGIKNLSNLKEIYVYMSKISQAYREKLRLQGCKVFN